MFKQKFLNTAVASFMALSISNIPQIAVAQVADTMISTTQVVEEITRVQARENILAHIERPEVQAQLKKMGLNSEEISQRMASLSDSELRDFSKQMDSAQYGGSIVGVLVIVVLVLLIIYLAKRI